MTQVVPVAAQGLMQVFADAQMISPADFHVARALMWNTPDAGGDPRVELAVALTVRALREGSVCLDITRAHELATLAETDDGESATTMDLPWPEPTAWLDALRASGVTGTDRPGPMVLTGTLLYLERYHRDETHVKAWLDVRRALPPTELGDDARAAGLRLDEHPLHARQEEAVLTAATEMTSVITGGPGTGKTTTVSRILDALAAQSPGQLFVALAAPTGKAAGRLTQAVAETITADVALHGSLTLYKLLGAAPSRPTRTHDQHRQLPHDVVVVDEVSMMSLSMMSWLLEAIGEHTRLILLGDPYQLTSVEEGSVLADIASAGLLPTVTLEHNHRSNQDINELSRAILHGHVPDALALLERSASCSLSPFDGDEEISQYPELASTLTTTGEAVTAAALAGDGASANTALAHHRILCAHREGRFGVRHWAAAARAWVTRTVSGYHGDLDVFAGQPLMMTRNNDLVSNGETAVVVQRGGRLVAAVDQPDGITYWDPAVLDAAADAHAMTIHKSQGSQFDVVSVVLPPIGSPLLTRELLYTAVTRARHGVRLYGSEEALATAIITPTSRTSGLRG